MGREAKSCDNSSYQRRQPLSSNAWFQFGTKIQFIFQKNEATIAMMMASRWIVFRFSHFILFYFVSWCVSGDSGDNAFASDLRPNRLAGRICITTNCKLLSDDRNTKFSQHHQLQLQLHGAMSPPPLTVTIKTSRHRTVGIDDDVVSTWKQQQRYYYREYVKQNVL